MKVELDFDYIDKKVDYMSIEERRRLEKIFIDFCIKVIINEEEDYCKKKGLNRDNLTYKEKFNMNKAINSRKRVKQAEKMLMSFDPILRKFFRDNKIKEVGKQK